MIGLRLNIKLRHINHFAAVILTLYFLIFNTPYR